MDLSKLKVHLFWAHFFVFFVIQKKSLKTRPNQIFFGLFFWGLKKRQRKIATPRFSGEKLGHLIWDFGGAIVIELRRQKLRSIYVEKKHGFFGEWRMFFVLNDSR